MVNMFQYTISKQLVFMWTTVLIQRLTIYYCKLPTVTGLYRQLFEYYAIIYTFAYAIKVPYTVICFWGNCWSFKLNLGNCKSKTSVYFFSRWMSSSIYFLFWQQLIYVEFLGCVAVGMILQKTIYYGQGFSHVTYYTGMWLATIQILPYTKKLIRIGQTKKCEYDKKSNFQGVDRERNKLWWLNISTASI